MRKNNGITLISLIITIIIMLILVGVSITLAVNGGLFEYAGNAVGDTKNAIADEKNIGGLQVGDTWYDSIGDYMDGIGWVTIYNGSEPAGEDGLITLSEKISDGETYRITVEGIGKVEAKTIQVDSIYFLFIINGDKIITFDSSDDLEKLDSELTEEELENISICIGANGETGSQIGICDSTLNNVDENYKITKIEKCNCSIFKIMWKKGELNVGDYVDYTPSGEITEINVDDPENKGNASGTLTGDTDAQTIKVEDLKWQVLGYDEEKDKLLLISETPTVATIEFSGYIGWNNYEDVLNNTCKALYSNTSIGATARSITMDDIDKYLDGNKYNKTEKIGGSDKKGGYGYRNQKVVSKYNINENGKLVKLETGTVTLDLTSDFYYYNMDENVTDTVKLRILRGTENTYEYRIATKYVGVSDDAIWGTFAFTTFMNIYIGKDLCSSNDNSGSLRNL